MCQGDTLFFDGRVELLKIIGDYDGLAIRSATKADKDVIAAAKNLKVVGRAGIGVDNIDVPAATAAGVVVMNTPFGNSITTAEHAIAMIFALARQLPAAERSQQLTALAEEAQTKISPLLGGSRGMDAYKQYGGSWLQNLVPRIAPVRPAIN